MRYRSTHEQRLERWLGAQHVLSMQEAMRHWYGPPIAVANVPGEVWIHGGGDLTGPIQGGSFSGLQDFVTRGVRQVVPFSKVSTSAISSISLWRATGQPASPGTGTFAAPGGSALDRTSAGALFFQPPASGNESFVYRLKMTSTEPLLTLILYDRLFVVEKTMNSTATEAVTGVPTRYQSTTPTDKDYAGGNFCTIETVATLAAGAHNWTVCQYTDQSGNTGASFASASGTSGNVTNRLDVPNNTWFLPLASGDSGVKALTQMQCDALIATGTTEFTMGHPLAIVPSYPDNCPTIWEGLNSVLGFVKVFDDACLAFLDVSRATGNAPTWNGLLTLVQG